MPNGNIYSGLDSCLTDYSTISLIGQEIEYKMEMLYLLVR